MGKLNVKNGTPVGNTHLCKSCSWGQFMIGYRESDLVVICTNLSPNLVVPFTVSECSEFSDKFKPTWEQMTKLAIEVDPLRVSAKTRGFQVAAKVRPIRADVGEEESGAEPETATVR
jgi:hypothetical protein